MRQTLNEIFTTRSGWGSFTRIGKAPDGSDQIQRFSHATAMGSLHERSRYRSVFGLAISKEIERLHPLIIAKLCRYACDSQMNIETLLSDWRTDMGFEQKADSDDLGDLVTKNGRLVPMPKHWNTLWNMLTGKSQAPNGNWTPPLPLILAGWNFSDDREKRARFMEHLAWAIDHDQINEVKVFLKTLEDNDWYYEER